MVAYSQGYLALIDCESGHFDRADARLEEAFKLAEMPADSSSSRARCAASASSWTPSAATGPACAAAAAELAPRAQRIGSIYMLAMSQSLGGYARYMQGERTEGVAAMRSGIEQLERAENGMNLSLLYSYLAGALSVIGSLDEAESLALRALERAEQQQDRMGEPTARRVLFAVAARRAPQGGPEVDAALEAAVEVARRRGSAREEALTWLRAAEVLAQALATGLAPRAAARLRRALRRAPDALVPRARRGAAGARPRLALPGLRACGRQRRQHVLRQELDVAREVVRARVAHARDEARDARARQRADPLRHALGLARVEAGEGDDLGRRAAGLLRELAQARDLRARASPGSPVIGIQPSPKRTARRSACSPLPPT